MNLRVGTTPILFGHHFFTVAHIVVINELALVTFSDLGDSWQ